MNTIEQLHSKGLIKPPPYVMGGLQYLTIMGSVSYGVSGDTSDMDLYGFCMPPKDMVFPHLAGEIFGFGEQIQRFEQWQQHHIVEKDTRKKYDICVYNIIKYFQLVMENNPNMIDSLFTREQCVLHSTKIANHVRDNRKLFLHRGAWHKFKGYAFSQMRKMRTKEPDGLNEVIDFEKEHRLDSGIKFADVESEIQQRGSPIFSNLTDDQLKEYYELFKRMQTKSSRAQSVKEHTFDVKFAYHVVRLLNEVEQILVEGDLDLMRNNDQLKDIRAGAWTIERIESYFYEKEKTLEKVYSESKLRYSPDQKAIKKVLIECLEEYYGSLGGCIQTEDHYKNILREIQKLVEKV